MCVMGRIKNCVILKPKILLLFIIASQCIVIESLSPYFFLCNYHGRLDPLPQENDKLLLSVTLDDNPKVYTPGEVYKVRITSSKDFNGLLITGLFSSSLNKEKINPSAFGMTSIGFNFKTPGTSDFVCGLVYSDYAPHKQPTSEVSFSWTAPTHGTGCVSFLLTASLGMQIVFQDVVAYQICEKGQEVLESRPSLADIHSDGVILRDDFDSGDLLDIWSSESQGVTIGSKCGEITHGNAAVICDDSPLRQLVTPSLNLTSASAIQFTTGAGTCQYSDNFITFAYQLQGEDDWVVIKYLSITKQGQVNIIQLPKEAKTDNVILRFSEEDDLYVSGCWALDNVLISESENKPTSLHENMDPIDTSKWLFMPGASIRGECMSQANAMVFVSEANDTSPTYAVTRDLDLSTTSVIGEAISDFIALGGRLQPNACGHTDEVSTFVFNETGKRQICTTSTDILQDKVAVQFVLSIGSAECVGDQYSSEVSLIAYFKQKRQVLRTFAQDYYKDPKKVIMQLPTVVQTEGAILCMEQNDNNGESLDVWAIDSFELIERQKKLHHFMQFSINMQCSSVFVETSVNVEYSNDFGRSWEILQEECLPETCDGLHWPYNSVYKTDMNQQWLRVSLPIPEAAITEHTRFRWIQVGITEREIRWAIDNIYIGSDENCPGMCSGHGTCLSDRCRCDVGFHGPICNVTHKHLPTSLVANFNTKDDFQNIFEMAYGSEIGYNCGMLGTGKALVFNGKGKRMVITKPHNGTNLNYIQFVILMGRHSSVGTCQAPKVPGDGVLIHYTSDRGVTWNLLEVISFDSERETKVVSIALPPEAKVPGIQVRWWQPNENDKGNAVWAIDDVILSSDLYKSIFSTPENYQKIYSSSVAFHTGMLTNYCNRTNVLLFSPQPPKYRRTLRYCETQTMETSAGYVLEADLILRKCGEEDFLPKNSVIDQNHELYLQYSKDEGVTWHLVQEENLPGSTNRDTFHPASIYHVSEFREWKTAILPMPKNTWSSSVRLRIVQNEASDSVWVLDSVYMGPACEMHCRNRGRCKNGKCSCYADSVGSTCLSRTPLPSGVNEVFDDVKQLLKSGWNLIGGSVATSSVDKEGCGSMPSEHYLHFSKGGVRKLATPDLDTSIGGQIQFYIRIGGGNCKVPTERANGVLLQYSNNGGVTWELLDELYYQDYQIPKYVHRDLPVEARTKQTRFQWWQPKNSGKDQDQWSISDVIVGEPMLSDDNQNIRRTLKLSSRRSVDSNLISLPRTFILLSNDGKAEDFCDFDKEAYVFDKLKGDRFAVTDDLYLRKGNTIQFEINIDCSDEFSWNNPVHLEFSRDEGYSWELVTRSCYPNGRPESQMDLKNPMDDLSAHDCTGIARELTEASVYYKGDYPTWRRVIISAPDRIISMPIRLRWWQHVPSNVSSDNLPPTWAIRSVHIGPSCPEQCSGHGTCTLGVGSRQKCICDKGYVGESCSFSQNPISQFWDHFTSPEPSIWWDNIIGLSEDTSCSEVNEGNSLYFGSEGSRIAQTKSLDTTGIRRIEFYLRLGSNSDSETCNAPEYRDEAIVLQYSNNNGITWHLIKELSFDAYTSRSEKIRVGIPFAAKTPLTSFRWWQPLQEQGDHRSHWALDDVLVGVPDLLSDGLVEDFENNITSDTNWYKVTGGGIGSFTHCDGAVNTTEKALVIDKANGVAETWDFHLNSGSFLQFDVVISCESENPANDFLSLEYSTDMGESWQLVIPSCMPSTSVGCGHGYGSVFYTTLHQKWTRQTVALSEALTSSSKIRFRWIQYYFTEGSSSWAIDNFYIGNGCPWMCSGHGRCWPSRDAGDICTCDPGFEKLPYCQPTGILPSMLMDTFDFSWNQKEKYIFAIGKFDDSADLIINGENLKMGMQGIRMIQTKYLNATEMKYIQFHVAYPQSGQNLSSILVLQSTINGGISWSTIHLINTANLDERNKKFVHVLLPDFYRHEAVSFRLWQANTQPASPIFEYGEEIWAIDNLLIGGRTGCEDHVREENFDVITDQKLSDWLFKSEKEISDDFCGSSGNALVINNTIGLRSIETNDLCVSENYVLQFKIAVDCSAPNSRVHGVRLEYSTDHGITWNLLQPLCHQNIPTSSGCSNKYHPASIYYPGTHPGWQRFIIPLDYDLCGSVRLRWYQGFYEDQFDVDNAVPWGLDEVYIGPGCDEMCNGHGVCSNEGETCVCDSGFEGKTCCDISTPSPEFFKDTFDNEDGIFDNTKNDKWKILSGGNLYHKAENCDDPVLKISNWIYRVEDNGQRILETRDLDMRNAEYIQFYFAIHLIKPSGMNSINGVNENKNSGEMVFPSLVTDVLYLQFSNYGGIEWNVLEIFPFSFADLNESRFIVLHLPEGARTNATRFRWWQPMRESKNLFGFSIDHVVIGAAKNTIDDEFESYDYSNWIEMSSAEFQPRFGSKCCSARTANGNKCDIIEVGKSRNETRYCDSNFLISNGVNVKYGSYISFNLNMNCEGRMNHCEDVDLQYSIDLGKTWLPLISPCLPSNAECTHYYQGSIFYSDVYLKQGKDDADNRIIVPIPEHARSPSTRFGWYQKRDLDSASWSLDNLYIGNECPGACFGHGRCSEGRCVCDEGWGGIICQTAIAQLPMELKEIFSSDFIFADDQNSMFTKHVGGAIDKVCEEVGFEYAFHFFGSCSRLLQTALMDTTNADFVQFMFQSTCGENPPTTRDHGILVDYTINGGAVWHNLAELYYKNYIGKPSFVNILLPEQAKAVGIQFRWWQPKHESLGHQDWAIDNILISGKKEEMMLSDDFNVKEISGPAGLWFDRGDKHMWQFYDNTEPNSFCGRDNVILAGTVPGLDTTVSTKDFIPEEGYMMQYTIVVLCQDVIMKHQPVHVQYSIDFGDTWQYLRSQCIPSDRDCFGKEVTQPSAHFIGPDWQRNTIWIPESLYGQPVRFRFHQEESDVIWALDHLFIGPSCPNACSGHGDCVGVPQDDMFKTGTVDYDVRRCLCDFGYGGPNCYLYSDGNKKYLKDDFNTGEQLGNWFNIIPHQVGNDCGVIVDGYSLTFSGVGPRQAVTEDLDLRDARFVQHNAVIGSNEETCLDAKHRQEGVLLQYSIDGGIIWHMLHELDYSSFQDGKHEYIELPLDAKTNGTRIRWWQPFTIDELSGLAAMGEDRAGWAIDNVYIGGQEVNADTLEENFEIGFDDLGAGNLDERKYDFYPNGQIGMGQCFGDNTNHMTWPGTDEFFPKQSFTTRQLIVSPGHMIQFKIKVGCGEEQTCSQQFPIRLEYREDPRYGDWHLVKPICFPSNLPSPDCPPYIFHDASVYKLENNNKWKRITVPLNHISSDTTQFRWYQDDHATDLYSWAIDDLYIGEACPNYCSGHGQCTKSLECVCDHGFVGHDCSIPRPRYVVPVFRDDFEHEDVRTILWHEFSGGIISANGCGPLRPYGFSRSAYFFNCGMRQLITREVDLRKAWQIQYVMQFGSVKPNKDCRVYDGGFYDGTPMSMIVLQYTTNNGITWHTLREHSPSHYGIPRRVAQSLPTLAKTTTTRLRWWQPVHRGAGFDQWALDNVDIIMTRRQRHLNLMDYYALLRKHQAQSRHIPPVSSDILNPSTSILKLKRLVSNVGEQIPPDLDLLEQ